METLGNKHLKLGMALLNHLYRDSATCGEVKDALKQRWQGKNTGTPDFLAADIRIVKWRTAKDGRNGVLEFKLTKSMIQVEEELVRVLIQKGGKLQSGPDARGRRVRAGEEQLEGTW